MSLFGCWIAYHVVTKWPGRVENRGLGRLWWWLLPHAGSYAHYWSEPIEYRRQMDQLRK
jgi:hypothetical protein